MKRHFTLLAAIALSALVRMNVSYSQSTWGVDTLKLSEELIATKIEEDTYLVIHSFPYPANSLLCKLTPVDYILVDTPYENDATRLVIEWIRQNSDSAKIKVINTHYHRDNLGGNGYLLEQNIPVYGSDLTVQLLNEKLSDPNQDNIADVLKQPQYKRYYDVFKNTELKPPDQIFKIDEGLKFEIGNETVEIFYPGAGHTQDNVTVYFHKRRILFGGCLLKALDWTGLGYTGESDIREWPNSLKKLLKKFPESRIVIPGHGDYDDLSLIHHTLDLLKNKN